MFLPEVDSLTVRQLWAHGTQVKVKQRRTIQARRRTMGYLSKTFEANRERGRHRYEVAQGFQPEATRIPARNLAEGQEVAIDHFGAEPAEVRNQVVSYESPAHMSLMYWNDPRYRKIEIAALDTTISRRTVAAKVPNQESRHRGDITGSSAAALTPADPLPRQTGPRKTPRRRRASPPKTSKSPPSRTDRRTSQARFREA